MNLKFASKTLAMIEGLETVNSKHFLILNQKGVNKKRSLSTSWVDTETFNDSIVIVKNNCWLISNCQSFLGLPNIFISIWL